MPYCKCLDSMMSLVDAEAENVCRLYNIYDTLGLSKVKRQKERKEAT